MIAKDMIDKDRRSFSIDMSKVHLVDRTVTDRLPQV